MHARTASPANHGSQAGNGRRWFSFLGGAVAWTLHLLGVYGIAEFGCVSGLGRMQWLEISVVTWLLLGLSLVLLLIALAAAIVGYRDTADVQAEDGVDQSGWMYLSRAGAIFSLLFAVIIAVESIPVLFYLGGC